MKQTIWTLENLHDFYIYIMKGFISIMVPVFLTCACTNPRSRDNDSINSEMVVQGIEEYATIADTIQDPVYNLDSILEVIKSKIWSAPQELQSAYFDSEIDGDHILVLMGDSCDRTVKLFKENVIDSPVVKFKQLISVVNLLWLEIDTSEIESPKIEKSLDEDIVDSSDSIVSDTLHLVNDEQETMDSVTAKSNL